MSTVWSHVPSKSFVVPWNDQVAAAAPHAKRLPYNGKDLMLLPAGGDEARLLRNTGHDCPSPLHLAYEWPQGRVPWHAQRVTAGEAALNPQLFILSEIGTGKTGSVLYAADYLIKSGQAKNVLVVCTLSTMTRVWENELLLHFPWLSRAILYGSRQRRIKRLETDPQVAIVNHHGVSVIDEELVGRFDIVIFDELSVYRNARTRLWKSANRIARGAKYIWGLTGSPIPESPADAYGEIKLVTPHRAPKHFKLFRDQTMFQVSQFRWVPRKDAHETVFRTMQPAVRFTRDQVMELPEIQEVDRDASLEGKQLELYKALVRKMVADVEGGQQITAVNEGVLINKLLQVSCGFVYTTSRETVVLPCQRRFDALLDLWAETNHKMLVFAPFTHAVKGVHDALVKAGVFSAMVYGDVSKTERDKIFGRFQDDTSLDVIVADPRTMAHGLTLTSANVVCWWSPPPSNEIYEQANGRINRPGQKNSMLIARLIGSPVEQKAYQRIASHARMQGMLLELLEQAQTETQAHV